MKKVVVHKFRMSDVDDPDMYAAQPLHEWEQSEKGKWITKHAADVLEWKRMVDHATYGYIYTISALFDEKTYIWYKLKFES